MFFVLNVKTNWDPSARMVGFNISKDSRLIELDSSHQTSCMPSVDLISAVLCLRPLKIISDPLCDVIEFFL